MRFKKTGTHDFWWMNFPVKESQKFPRNSPIRVNGSHLLNEFQRNFAIYNVWNIGCSLYHWWSGYTEYCCWIQKRSVASIGWFESKTQGTWLNHHWKSSNDHRRSLEWWNVSEIISSEWMNTNLREVICRRPIEFVKSISWFCHVIAFAFYLKFLKIEEFHFRRLFFFKIEHIRNFQN